MLSKDYYTKIPSRGVGLVTPAQGPPSIDVACTKQGTLHATFPQPPPDVHLRPPFASREVHDSCDGVVAVSRRHFVVHGPACGPIMQCGRRSEAPPFVTRVSEGIPRAHIVPTTRMPERCDLDALWARTLASGPLIGEGDRLWLDGVGEVVLRESKVTWTSPYWKFFFTWVQGEGWVELAVEWRFVRLTRLERRRRTTPIRLPPLTSFLEFDEERVRYGGWREMWARLFAGIVALVFGWGVRAA